jgi:putative hemolysin
MNTLVKLEMSVRIFNSEEEKGKAASNAVQSNRRKPFVIGVANHYAAYCEEKIKIRHRKYCNKN